jgi:hypothetical protein
MNDHVHVFVGSFESREAACLYTEAQWEAEPPESVSDEEYEEWEDRNPNWPLREDLGGLYLNCDFIETIADDDRYDYLGRYLTESGAIDRVRKAAGTEPNILVLIFSGALGGFPAVLKSTPRLLYCGEFACKL